MVIVVVVVVVCVAIVRCIVVSVLLPAAPPKPNRKAIATVPLAIAHVLASPLCARIRRENLKMAIHSFPRLDRNEIGCRRWVSFPN